MGVYGDAKSLCPPASPIQPAAGNCRKKGTRKMPEGGDRFGGQDPNVLACSLLFGRPAFAYIISHVILVSHAIQTHIRIHRTTETWRRIIYLCRCPHADIIFIFLLRVASRRVERRADLKIGQPMRIFCRTCFRNDYIILEVFQPLILNDKIILNLASRW